MRCLLGSTSGLMLVLAVLASPAAADDRGLCASGTGEEAIAACTRVLASNDLTRAERVKALVSRGTQYWAGGNPNNTDRGLADFNAALALDSDNVAALLGRCRASMAKKDWDHAIANCSEVLRRDPKNIFALTNRGGSYADRGDLDAALSDLTAAVRLNPRFAVAFYNRATVYARKKEYTLAIADVSEFIRFNPNNAVGFWRRGVFYDTQHEVTGTQLDLDRAVSDYKEALRLNPGAEWASSVTERVRELTRADQPPPAPQQAQPAPPGQTSPSDSSDACRRFPALC